MIKPGDLRRVFADHLDHPVTEQDINDIMAICDKNGTGQITYGEFYKFYFSWVPSYGFRKIWTMILN